MFNWDPKTGDVIVPQNAISKVSPLYPKNVTIVPGNPVPSPSDHDFVPRLGAAYRLNDKTVIRGGYGIFNEFLGQFSRIQSGGPLFVNGRGFNCSTHRPPPVQFPEPLPSL